VFTIPIFCFLFNVVPPSLNTDETEDKQTNFTVNLGSGVVLPCKVEGDPLDQN
jgi:hypothetical protein